MSKAISNVGEHSGDSLKTVHSVREVVTPQFVRWIHKQAPLFNSMCLKYNELPYVQVIGIAEEAIDTMLGEDIISGYVIDISDASHFMKAFIPTDLMKPNSQSVIRLFDSVHLTQFQCDNQILSGGLPVLIVFIAQFRVRYHLNGLIGRPQFHVSVSDNHSEQVQ